MSQLLLLPDSELWALPRLSVPEYRPPQEFPPFRHYKRVSLDLETDGGLDPMRGAYIVGVSIKTPDWAEYFPIRHKGGPNCDEMMLLWWLQDELEAFEGELIGANSNLYDGFLLRRAGIKPKKLTWVDVQWAEALLDELSLSYRLDALAQKYEVGRKLSNFLKDLYGEDVMSHFSEVHPAHARTYALQDADIAEAVYDKQIPILKKEGLLNLFRLECRLTPLLNSMRERGIRVDIGKAEEVNQVLKGKVAAAMEKIVDLTGFACNINSPGDLARACDQLGVGYPTT